MLDSPFLKKEKGYRFYDIKLLVETTVTRGQSYLGHTEVYVIK